jgi:hypothetical protein
MTKHGLPTAAFILLVACSTSAGPSANPYAGAWHPQSGFAFYVDPGFYDFAGCAWGVATLTVSSDGTFQQSWSSGCVGAPSPATVKGTITTNGHVSGTLNIPAIAAADFSGTCSAPTATAACTGSFSTLWSTFHMMRS